MKPLIFSAQTPTDIDKDFSIDWENLIVSGLDIEHEVEFDYLVEIGKYSNNGGIPTGIIAKTFEFRQDEQFEKLLSMVHYLNVLAKKFIPNLFAKTAIRNFLKEFQEEDNELQNALSNADFEYMNSFDIEGNLAQYLYRYGMYTHFYQDHSAEEARQISVEFMKSLFDNDVDNVICFHTHHAWGKWFDKHSCSDWSLAFINKRERMIWLFCFSHSD